VQGNVSDLLYLEVGLIDVMRMDCSGKVTFSFELHFVHNFYELIWDSELCCSEDELEAMWNCLNADMMKWRLE
jgi:hypothetical protein